MARDAHGHARDGHHRKRAAPLRTPNAPFAAERPVLVSGPRLGHGHGLAFLGHHHVGHGRAQEGPESTRRELGVYICGGRGKQSRNTPRELQEIAARTGLDGDALVRTSRLTARIDNNAVADGFQIYLHAFILTADGDWAVVQQGMNEASRLARRYHWHSATVGDFLADPHTAIVGAPAGTIRNLVDRRRGRRRTRSSPLRRDDPETTIAAVRRLEMPRHHDVRASDVNARRLGAVLALAQERDVQDFASFLLLEQLGPRTLQSLALVAEVVHGTPTRFDDPARFAFAHGGKDGHPFPVPLRVYDESIAVLRRALDAAKLGQTDKLPRLRPARRPDPHDRAASEPRSRHRSGDRARARDLRHRSADGRSWTIDGTGSARASPVAGSSTCSIDGPPGRYDGRNQSFGQYPRRKNGGSPIWSAGSFTGPKIAQGV